MSNYDELREAIKKTPISLGKGAEKTIRKWQDEKSNGSSKSPRSKPYKKVVGQKTAKLDQESLKEMRWYSDEEDEGIPVPILGPDLIDPRDFPEKMKADGEGKNEAKS
jgi:hypothetical protein